jgi:hypothetical protein
MALRVKKIMKFLYKVGLEVLTAASMKMAVFWVAAPRSVVEVSPP